MTRMTKNAFMGLLELLEREGGLKASARNGASTGEKLMTFLYTIGQGTTTRVTADRFQRSTKTISKNLKQAMF